MTDTVPPPSKLEVLATSPVGMPVSSPMPKRQGLAAAVWVWALTLVVKNKAAQVSARIIKGDGIFIL